MLLSDAYPDIPPSPSGKDVPVDFCSHCSDSVVGEVKSISGELGGESNAPSALVLSVDVDISIAGQ